MRLYAGLLLTSLALMGCTSKLKSLDPAKRDLLLPLNKLSLNPTDVLVCGSLQVKPGSQVAEGIQIELRRPTAEDLNILLIEGRGDYAKFEYEGPIREGPAYLLKSGDDGNESPEDKDEVQLEMRLLKEENLVSLEGVTDGTAYDNTPFTLECVNDAKEAFPQESVPAEEPGGTAATPATPEGAQTKNPVPNKN